jgi:hypothetical protein
MRRTKEFDKPDMITKAFYGIAPEFHAGQITGESWRYQRKLIQDLVTPAFLSGVAAPQLHENFLDLVKLWSEKMRLSEGRPFPVKHDIYETALEAIWAAIFGIEDTATVTRNQISLLSAQKDVSLPSSVDKAVEFERAPAPPAFRAVLDLTESIEEVGKSPYPKVVGFLQRYRPTGRKNLALKDEFITKEIVKAEKRMQDNEGKETNITNAVDHMLRRENMGAEKLQRAPQYFSRTMINEVSHTPIFMLNLHIPNPHPSSSASSSPATTPPQPPSSGASNSSPPTNPFKPNSAPPYAPPFPTPSPPTASPPPTKSPPRTTTTSTPASRKSTAAAAQAASQAAPQSKTPSS